MPGTFSWVWDSLRQRNWPTSNQDRKPRNRMYGPPDNFFYPAEYNVERGRSRNSCCRDASRFTGSLLPFESGFITRQQSMERRDIERRCRFWPGGFVGASHVPFDFADPRTYYPRIPRPGFLGSRWRPRDEIFTMPPDLRLARQAGGRHLRRPGLHHHPRDLDPLLHPPRRNGRRRSTRTRRHRGPLMEGSSDEISFYSGLSDDSDFSGFTNSSDHSMSPGGHFLRRRSSRRRQRGFGSDEDSQLGLVHEFGRGGRVAGPGHRDRNRVGRWSSFDDDNDDVHHGLEMRRGGESGALQ
ncbi:MAG: hypothetical protein M1827_001857 [Pycnora praestabilis]|nr:MAG: hypothetical protein M1827_001857 [Pycnora praestabilis]